MFPRPIHLPIVLLLLLLGSGCGKKAPPLPPEPRGPNTPAALSVRQVGRSAHLSFVLPQPRGAKVSQQMVRVDLIRVTYQVENAPPPDPDAFRRRGELIRVMASEQLVAGERVELTDPTIAELENQGSGSTLRYAVRVVDRRGRSSAWVASSDLVLVPELSAPTQLSAEPTAAGVRLVWAAEAEHGFNLYRSVEGETSRAPLNDQPIRANEYLDEDVQIGHSYTYSVRRLLAAGRPLRESNDSVAAGVTALDRFPPRAPRGLVAVQERKGVRLFWDPSPERDVRGYRVRRSVDAGPFEPIGPDPVERPLFLDTDVRPGNRVRYRVSSIDGAAPPNESEATETESLMLIDEPGGAAGVGD